MKKKCDAMGHYGRDPLPEGMCPKCYHSWDFSLDFKDELTYPPTVDETLVDWITRIRDERIKELKMVKSRRYDSIPLKKYELHGFIDACNNILLAVREKLVIQYERGKNN